MAGKDSQDKTRRGSDVVDKGSAVSSLDEMLMRARGAPALSAPSPPNYAIPGSPPFDTKGAQNSPVPDNLDGGPISPDATDRVFPIRSFVSVDPTPTPSQVSEKKDSYFSPANRRSNHRGLSVGPESPKTSSDIAVGASQGSKNSPVMDREVNSSRNSSTSTSATLPDRRQSANTGLGLFNDIASTGSGVANSVSDSHSVASRPDDIVSARSFKSAEDTPGIYTARFKHVVTEGGHAIITGRDGDILQRCEDEPIHIPGAVQSFGLLVALHEEAEGKLAVRIVSENSKRVIGYTPLQLFNLESFTDILSEEQTDNFLDHIDFIKDDAIDVKANGPEVFTMSIKNPQKKSQKLWCAIHQVSTNSELIICEFELEDDPQYPLVPPNAETPEPPEDTLQSMPTAEELRESTEAMNKPLRVLRGARKRRGEAAAMEVFNIMSQVQEQLADAPDLESFLKVLVGVIKELTGFHRVMIYQFDASFNGKVVTELVDPRATADLYKGLHFPASDIPKQARDLYRTNRVRLLYDRDLETSRLVCRTISDLEIPLDLTHSYLRAMSPIHVKYLANMAVRSSMSISINAFNELWGLISCHAYGSRGTRVSFPIRKMCRLVGDSASRNIERLSYASRLQARKLINTASTERNPSGYIIASSDDLLKLFNADFGLLSIHDETKILGKIEATQEALALLEYLRIQKFVSVVTSQDIRVDFPDLRYPPGFQVVAGLLHIPLSPHGQDFIVFFRKGHLREVKWAGNPYEKFVKAGTEGFLEPRKSFKTWRETVIGKCREWAEDEVETAAVLCLVYGKFIEVWRQKEAALQNSQLTKLLLANSAHEVRTPLNAIINCLEIALEGSLDADTRENLARSHSASKSLIYVINDLLDLTKSTENAEIFHGEVFDLANTFHEATNMFQGDAKRKNILLEISIGPGLPEKVIGEQRRVRQAISNITANAIQATNEGSVKVGLSVVTRSEQHIDVEVAVEDTGTGMNSQKLDELFAELEQAQSEPSAMPDENTNKTLTERKEGKKTLGLGLAIVARIVRNMDGQLRLKSEEGKGSRFVLQFPFELPETEHQLALEDTSSTPAESVGTIPGASAKKMSTKSSLTPGEVTLVEKATNRRDNVRSPSSLSRKNSSGSIESRKSMASIGSNTSGRSDVDRMIEAMQEPLLSERPRLGDRALSRSGNSRSEPSRYDTSAPTSPRHRSDHVERHSMSRSPDHHQQTLAPPLGLHAVADSRTPIRAVRVPDELDSPISDHQPIVSPIVGETYDDDAKVSLLSASGMRILVAEDDPINSKIIQRRLEKAGHEIFLTVNGQECANTYREGPGQFDVILMDMQMPFLDGADATSLIRSFEKSEPQLPLSQRASLSGRIPIIAVSASLVEQKRQSYIDAGFDGWILKPISFPRLGELLTGIVDTTIRQNALYKPGHWELGGWFHEAGQLDTSAEPESDPIQAGPS